MQSGHINVETWNRNREALTSEVPIPSSPLCSIRPMVARMAEHSCANSMSTMLPFLCNVLRKPHLPSLLDANDMFGASLDGSSRTAGLDLLPANTPETEIN